MVDQISVSKDICAPPDEVWAIVTDLPRMGEWSHENEGGEWIKGATGPVPGARFKGTNGNGSKSWTTEATVLDAEPGRRFSFRVAVGPIKVAEWSYSIEPTPAGCRVTESWIDRRPRFVRPLGKMTSGVEDRPEHNRIGMVQTLDRIAAAVERPSGQNPDSSPDPG
jgi:uncharacterized protein YndB with AHSA1/START domain